MSSLQGRVAVITGASRGLGRAIARELHDHGACVVINYYQSRELAEELAAELNAGDGQRAICIQAGVVHPDEVQAMMDATVERFGGIDILVNNAGVNRDRTLKRMAPEDWREVLAVDLDGTFYCCSAAVPHLIQCGGGCIVNMSSIIGQMGNVGQANYAAAKAGIVGFTKSLAQELVRHNITVNAVCLGFIATDMVNGLNDEVKEALVARIPMGRFGLPEEVARLVRFLAAEGSYITGQQFNINGGMYM
jgi:acetoacetyl-CoA reductase